MCRRNKSEDFSALAGVPQKQHAVVGVFFHRPHELKPHELKPHHCDYLIDQVAGEKQTPATA